MFVFKGYKGVEYQADYGWSISDTNGRTGKLLTVYDYAKDGEAVLDVETNYQATIQLCESEISFVCPPDEEDAA